MTRGKATHTHFRRNKRVRLVLVSGEVVIGRFVERRSRTVVLDCGEYATNTIRVMGFAHPSTR